MPLSIPGIARVCHAVNRAYCRAIGDDSQLAWDEAPTWQRESAINGVQFHIANPSAKPSDSHERLPLEQRVKDSLFIAVVHELRAIDG